MQYRRVHAAGGTYFFTVNLADRSADTLVRHIDDLRDVLYKVKAAHPFSLVAMVMLPEHLHAIWRLPDGVTAYPSDELDLAKHVDYIHNNPVKHGWVQNPEDWPHSILHSYTKLAKDGYTPNIATP